MLIISLDNDNMKPLNCDEKDYYLFKLPNQLQYTEQHSYTQGQGAVKSQERTKLLQLQPVSFIYKYFQASTRYRSYGDDLEL